MSTICNLNEIQKTENFNEELFAIETTSEEGEVIKIIPAAALLGWFRTKFPDAKTETVEMKQIANGGWFAKVRIYTSINAQPHEFIADGIAIKYPIPGKPEVSPAEWAETAALARAIHHAGFGLGFKLEGYVVNNGGKNEDPDIPVKATDDKGNIVVFDEPEKVAADTTEKPNAIEKSEITTDKKPAEKESTDVDDASLEAKEEPKKIYTEEEIAQAAKLKYPFKGKFANHYMGEVDLRTLNWIINDYPVNVRESGKEPNMEVINAAKVIVTTFDKNGKKRKG